MIVLEVATQDNFFQSGYLLANLDVAQAVRNGLTTPWQHLIEFGEGEKRKQISELYLQNRAELGYVKYERFRSYLGARRGLDEDVHFLGAEDAFPISVGVGYDGTAGYLCESANDGYGPFIDEIRSNPEKSYLDLGCGLRNEVFDNCLYLEVYPSLTADVVVTPTCRYPIADESFDGIGCLAVLEHVPEPWTVVSEIHRMLKPGGRCFIAWPFLQPVHAFPSHYFNATRHGLERLFSSKFDVEACKTEPWEGPNFTISWILGKFVHSLPTEKRQRVLDLTVSDLVAETPTGPFWTELLKDLPDSVISEFACGNSLIAKKR